MINFTDQNAEQLMQAAHGHHMAGRFAEAEKLYRQVLALNPSHADAWHLLGALACQVNQPAAGMELIGRAVALNPAHAVYRSNLGEACQQAGEHERSEAEFKRAIAIDPGFHGAYINLASLYLKLGRWQEARVPLETVLQQAPDHAVAWRLRGDALAKLGLNDQALADYQRALALKPDYVDANFNLGAMLADGGRFAEAEAAFRRVIASAPEDWDARVQLADTMVRMGRAKDAFTDLMELVAKNPSCVPAYSRIANMLRSADRIDEALRAYDRALALTPDDWVIRSNRAFAMRDQARLGETMEALEKLLAEKPELSSVHSGLIFSMFLIPGVGPEALARQQALWNRRHGDLVAGQRAAFSNDPSPNRRLRVGYVSSDLRKHPVGRFMLPLLKNHDRTQLEVFCYRGSRQHDEMTDQIAAASDHFEAISGMGDDQAAAVIRKDQIDILIDLSNHTIDNRLMLFARKPAPVQISYLAFNAGTGVETFDWRLTDALIDPPGIGDDAPFERPLRLAETYWCYAPTASPGPVPPLPALGNGFLTFGSFNYFSKCNDEVLALWAELMREVADARLVMHVPVGSRQEYVKTFFAQRGVSAERIDLFGRINEVDYFLQIGRVDMALDTFPWAGGTTTCDALYMGVPVITLAPPEEHASVPRPAAATLQRGGVSLLTNLGHPEWIARSPEEYIRIARGLGADRGRLAAIRSGLREKMQKSVLMDAPRFARNVEAAYRQAWNIWCAQQVGKNG